MLTWKIALAALAILASGAKDPAKFNIYDDLTGEMSGNAWN